MLLTGSSADARVSPPAERVGCEYRVQAGIEARELRVEARIAPGRGGSLLFDPGSWRFVRDLEVDEGRGWARRTLHGEHLEVRRCRERPCRVRYRFLLADAASSLGRRKRVFAQENVVVAPLSVWLVHPGQPAAGDLLSLSVGTPPDMSFVTAMLPDARGASIYEAPLADLDEAPLGAFGRIESQPIALPDGVVDVAIVRGTRSLSFQAMHVWVDRSARAIAAYFGRFPLSRTLVVLLPGRGGSVGYGTTRGGRAASILVWVGRETSEAELKQDWVLVHEMVHLGFPNMPREQRWLEEGLATYLEPIVKVRHGLLAEAEMWQALLKNLPRGVAAGAQRGLDGSGSIDALYWGGALFWFLADLEIRERTGGSRSLRDSLAGILAAGGSIAASWDLQKLLEEADRSAGVPVMKPLYERLGPGPFSQDLDSIWRRLGIVKDAEGVRFDDEAPLAGIRRRITGD